MDGGSSLPTYLVQLLPFLLGESSMEPMPGIGDYAAVITYRRKGDNLNILLNVAFTNNGWTTEIRGSDEN